jgi:hypothetical protein
MNNKANVVKKTAKNNLYVPPSEYGVLFPLLFIAYIPHTRKDKLSLY